MPELLRGLVLDLDGTLIESVGIKDQAFEALFSSHVDAWPEIRAYHLTHNHVVRFIKFRHITETILGQPYDAAVEADLSARFSREVFGRIVACPEVPGAMDFLRDFSRRLPLVLVSMTPDDELEAILRARGMRDFFATVYGASWRKADAVAHLLAQRGWTAGEAAFVGDTPEDQATAAAAGMPFIWRDSGKPRGASRDPVFPDMIGVAAYLESMCSHKV